MINSVVEEDEGESAYFDTDRDKKPSKKKKWESS